MVGILFCFGGFFCGLWISWLMVGILCFLFCLFKNFYVIVVFVDFVCEFICKFVFVCFEWSGRCCEKLEDYEFFCGCVIDVYLFMVFGSV